MAEKTSTRLFLRRFFAAALVSYGPFCLHAQSNLLKNSGFEAGNAGIFPADWTQEKNLRNKGSATVEAKPGGGLALRLSPNGKNNNPNEPFGVAQVIRMSDVGSNTLYASGLMRSVGGAQPLLLVLPMTSKMKPLAVIDIKPERASGDFQPVNRQVEIDKDAVYLVIACIVGGTSGEAWFDDVVVSSDARSGAVSSNSNAYPVPSGAHSAKIEIDAKRTLRSIPKTLYGTNVEWIYSANGMWDSAKNQVSPAVTAAARRAGISTVRFPGGVFADFYHWRDGLGPRESRPSRNHSPSDKNSSPNSFGTDELMQFCREVGCEPMLQVNITTGTPEEAADWVRYCNDANNAERARNGSREPYRVRYWEIGNEEYIRGDSGATHQAYLSPADYSAKFLRFAEAMKKADPSIEVGAVGGRNFGKYGFATDANWNKVVLQRAAHAIDFFSVHNAYAPVAASQSKRSVEDTYRAMFAFTKQIERNLVDLQNEIKSTAKPQDAQRIRVAVTEWGPYFHVIPSDPYLDHVKTMGSGIFSALAFQIFIENPITDFANFFKLTDVAWLGWVANDGNPTPSLLALEMFAKHFGTKQLAADVQSATFDAPEAGMVAAERGVPLVSAVASLNDAGNRLYVIAVNTDLTNAQDTEISIRGVNPSGNGTLRVISAASLDSNNGQRLPSVPGVRWANPAKASRNSEFESGRRGNVQIRESALSASGSFHLSLPPMSITGIELTVR